MDAGATTLKAKLKRLEHAHAEHSRIRIHRAISWLARAEAEEKDLDARFIFLWIAFNAAYAQEFGFETTERRLLGDFLLKLLAVDGERRLHRIVFEKYSGPVRLLIDNRYVFEPFWRALREHDSSGQWEEAFSRSQRTALASIMGNQTQIVLAIVFDRLYVLRNQLVHGGATWKSKLNRSQVRDGVNLLQSLVPIILDLMLDHPTLDLGAISYPVVA